MTALTFTELKLYDELLEPIVAWHHMSTSERCLAVLSRVVTDGNC